MTTPDDWEVLEQVGVGAHAVVHRAVRRDQPGRVVALKRLRDTDPAAVAELEREAAILADLSHPAIAVLHDVLVEPDGIALVLALAPGGTLADRLAREGRLPWPEVADLGARLADALAAGHDAGIVHRDVKPSNILFGREDEPRLADFGLARFASDQSWSIDGTVGYLDPEVAHGGEPGARSDLWSLGVVLFECLAGGPPFVGVDAEAIARAADRGVHLPLRDLVEAPDELVGAVERAMGRDPSRRFADGRELATILAGLVPATGAPVGPSGTDPSGTDASGTDPSGTDASGIEPSGVEPTEPERPAALVAGPDRGGTTDDTGPGTGEPPGSPPDPTVTWGPRPPKPDVDGPEPAVRTRVRWLVALLAALPLLAAGWALVRVATPDAPVDQSTEPSAAPSRMVATGLIEPVRPVDETPAPSAALVAGPRTSSGRSVPPLLATWRPRTPPAGCVDQVRRAEGPDRWWADVDGRGCGVEVRLEPVDAGPVDAESARQVVVVGGDSEAAGSWDLGPAAGRVKVGDWDGDGVDSPAVVAADGQVWLFDDWVDGSARPGGRIEPGPVAVAVDRSGRDHVVPAGHLVPTGPR